MTSDVPRLSRVHVVINTETSAVLAEITDREQITVTEAVRRLTRCLMIHTRRSLSVLR